MFRLISFSAGLILNLLILKFAGRLTPGATEATHAFKFDDRLSNVVISAVIFAGTFMCLVDVIVNERLPGRFFPKREGTGMHTGETAESYEAAAYRPACTFLVFFLCLLLLAQCAHP